MPLTRSAAVFAITLYQRHLSPRKGYRCAYRAHTGCASCSTLGARAIRRYGVLAGLALLRGRLQRCALAYRRIAAARQARHLPPRPQRGFIDSCDLPCDAGCFDAAAAGECIGNIAGSCDPTDACTVADCSTWKRKKGKLPADDAHLPPQRAW